jgi:hypothetical protein
MTSGINLAEKIRAVTKKLGEVNAEIAWEAAGTAADVAGMVDPTPISDAIGAGIAVRNGDFLGAGLNVVGMVPYLGDALAKPIKATRAATKLAALQRKAAVLTKELGDLNALRKQEEAAEQAAKTAKMSEVKKLKDAEKKAAEQEKVAAKNKDKDCEDCSKTSKTPKVMKELVVKPCFSAKRLSALKSEEFKNQLKRQEDALNKMTVKEFKDARVLYLKNKRKGTGKVQKEARIQYDKKLLRALTKEHRKTKSPLDAATDAKNETTARMENLAALHEPDMIAGGKDIISDIGDRSVNSSIGSQWKNRVRFIDDAISDISQIDGENTKMNVKLENCK